MQINIYCVNDTTPVFSWIVKDTNDKMQKAYRITVRSTDGNCVWDSGTVFSDRSVFVKYAGQELFENTKYFYKVTVTTENATYESDELFFITGLKNVDTLKWITADKSIVSPIIYKDFVIENVCDYATLNVCGLGFFEVYINGEKVSDELMNPVRTDYDEVAYSDAKYTYVNTTRKSVKYLSYEVSEFLRKGKNTIAVWLGNGWYRPTGRTRTIEGKFDYGNELKMFFKLTNGDDIIESDLNCCCINSPLIYDNMFYGEIYDARIKGTKSEVYEVKAPAGRLEPQLCPPERILKTYTPIALENGVYDSGICMTGFAEITCSGNAGDTVEIYYAEELDENGELDYTSTVGYEESDADQIQKDVYILNGNKDERYMPRFVWHGYRYFKIVAPDSVSVKDVKAHYVCTDLKLRTSFESSSELLNNIHKMFVNTHLTNTHGCVPMDCPHRERLGYTGDGELSSMSVMYNFDAYQMYRKWIDDIFDAQYIETGFVPHTAPFNGGGGGVAWGSSVAVVPWNLYMQYGDKEILEKCRPYIKRWIEYLKVRTENGIVVREEAEGWALGDWCMPSKYPWSEPNPDAIRIPPNLVNTIYYIYCIDIYNEISDVLGLENEYLDDRKKSAEAIDIFYSDGNYADDEQGANFFPLFAGVARKENVVLENAVERIVKSDYVFDTGISGNKFMLNSLDRYGKNDIAIKMMLNTKYPGLGYMINNGATAAWETWEGTGSKNHTAFTSCDSWLFYGLCGIKPFGGYKEFSVKPHFAKELDKLSASIECEYGTISLKWERKQNGIDVEIGVPFNTTAYVNLNGKILKLNAGIYKEVVK